MRIACVSASKIPSATANSLQVMKACQALRQLGHEVRLWVPAQENSLEWERLAAFYGLQTPFEVRSIPAIPWLRRYDFSLRAVLEAKQAKADLLYAWPLQAAVFGLVLRIPVAVELHGPPEGRLGPVLFRFLRRLPGKRRLLPITQALADMILQIDRKPFRDGEVVITPNGVDLERFQALPEAERARARLGLPEALTVGYTGHFYSGRGMELLLELARRFPQVQFLWVGGREAEVKFWKQRLEQELIENVRLPGFVDNIQLPLYQAASDILLMPYEQVVTGSSGGNSADYCSPMKMFEYMACGRAIVSSDLPVIREVLTEASCIFCPPEDIESWVRALKGLTEDPVMRGKLGLQCQHDILAYTWVKRAEKALAGFA